MNFSISICIYVILLLISNAILLAVCVFSTTVLISSSYVSVIYESIWFILLFLFFFNFIFLILLLKEKNLNKNLLRFFQLFSLITCIFFLFFQLCFCFNILILYFEVYSFKNLTGNSSFYFFDQIKVELILSLSLENKIYLKEAIFSSLQKDFFVLTNQNLSLSGTESEILLNNLESLSLDDISTILFDHYNKALIDYFSST